MNASDFPITKMRALAEIDSTPFVKHTQDEPADWDAPGDPDAVTSRIVASAYRWIAPAKVPRRKFLHRQHYIRQYLSFTAAGGGFGKTTFSVLDMLSMVIGKDLLTGKPIKGGPYRVWFYQCEDPLDEMQRKIQATCVHYGISEADLGGRLFLNSSRDVPLVIAREIQGAVCYVPADIEAVKTQAKQHQIDVLILDPLVATHRVNENSNVGQDEVMAVWKTIATECNIAIEALHHLRKTNGVEATIDDARGAGAMVNAARSVRLVCQMSPQDAKIFGIEEQRRRFYGWVNPNAKANFAPPATTREWFQFTSVDLGNGDADGDSDKVGVVIPWTPPDSLAEVSPAHVVELRKRMATLDEDGLRKTCRVSALSKGWIGILVGDILDFNFTDARGKSEITRIVKSWESSKVLKEDSFMDEKGKKRPFYRLGSAA